MRDPQTHRPQMPLIPTGYRSSDRIERSRPRTNPYLVRAGRDNEPDVPAWALRLAVVLIALVIALILLTSCSACQAVSVQSAAGTPPGAACASYTWSVARGGDSATLRQTAHGTAVPPLTLFFDKRKGMGSTYRYQGALPQQDAITDRAPDATLVLLADDRACLTLGIEDDATDPCLASLRGATTCVRAPALP
jgi:hypothetical protein